MRYGVSLAMAAVAFSATLGACTSSPTAHTSTASRTSANVIDVSATQRGLDAFIAAHPAAGSLGIRTLTACPYGSAPSLLRAVGQAGRFPSPYFVKSPRATSTDRPITELSFTVELHSGVAGSPYVQCRADGGGSDVAELDMQAFQELTQDEWRAQILSAVHGPFRFARGQLYTGCSADPDLGTTDCNVAWFPGTERFSFVVACQWAGATETACGDVLRRALPLAAGGLATR